MNFRLDWKKITTVGTLIVVLLGIMVVTGSNEEKYYEISKSNSKEEESLNEKNDSLEVDKVAEIDKEVEDEKIAIKEKEEPEKVIVYICGAVKSPIVAYLTQEHRLNDAVQVAGGLSDMANKEGVNLAMKLSDGAQYIIPKKGEELIINYDNSGNVTPNETDVLEEVKNSEGKLNINTSSAKDMEELPGVGEVLSERIVKYREEHKGFKSVEELKQVEGIGDKKYESIKEYVVV